MPYSPPEQWSHGEFPTATKMNLYKDGLDAIHDLLGDAQIHYAVARRMGNLNAYYFINKYRWLIYRGDGGIHDPNDVGETVALSGDGSNWLTYDLLQVEWLVPGKLYRVEDCLGAFEDYEALN